MLNLKLSIAITVFLCAVLSIWLPSLQNTITVLTALFGLLEVYSQRDRIKAFVTPPPPPPPIDPTCGDRPIDLADQRLHVSLTFGAYFTSLLEKEQLFTDIPGQLVCARAAQSHIHDPLQYAMWTLIDAEGARILLLAAEGGMGKSTLASKLIRCLYAREDIDMILGDSAKRHVINPTTGSVDTIQPGYDSASSFLERVSAQLGLVYQPHLSEAQQITNIRDRLIGRRAIIVVDNLESVQHSDKLIAILASLVGRHIRAIITTRVSSGFQESQSHLLSIRIKPLTDITQARNFVQWHIQRFQSDHPRLALLAQHVPSDDHMAWLLRHSGGIPLLIQVLVSEVA
ncbi:MAG: AAA family ATPase, partial [Roseiflexaceae bacterium]